MPLITSNSSILLGGSEYNAVTDVTKVTRFTLLASHLRGIIQTSAHVLRSEVLTLLAKGAVEMVPLANSESGFYSCYYLVPKKDGVLRPILDLRHLNRSLMRRPFRMLTLKQILVQICAEDWFSVCGSERHILSHPNSPLSQIALLRSVGTQSLRQMGIRILNYLVPVGSEQELIAHRSLLLIHLEHLRLRVNSAKSFLTSRQRVSYDSQKHVAPPILAQKSCSVPCLVPIAVSEKWPPGQLLAYSYQACSWEWPPIGRYSRRTPSAREFLDKGRTPFTLYTFHTFYVALIILLWLATQPGR